MTSEEPLGARGRKLHDELSSIKEFNPAEAAVLLEACRMVDRLEELDGIIHGKGVINLMHLRHMSPSDDSEVTMLVDNVFAEARQLQLAFQRMVASLKIEAGAVAVVKVDKSDDLAAQRERRRQAASS